LLQRHKISSVLTVSFNDGCSCGGLEFAHFSFELGDAMFEIKHSFHPSQVQTFVCELLDASQKSNVDFAVSAAPAGSTSWFH
jgi:hypothetical protein